MSSLPRVDAKKAINSAHPKASAAAAPLAQPAADPAEITRLRELARESGFAQGRAEGLASGHAEGYAAGLEVGKAAAQAQAEQLRALASALPDALRRAESEVAQSLLDLALDIARQVVHRSLCADPSLVVQVVQDLLRLEPALQGDPRLLLHPLDAQLVTTALGAELNSAGWQVRSDESLTRGGCVVQSGTGAHDARVESRWARVTAALRIDQPLS